MWENPGGTDVPAAGRGDVQCHLRVDCSWSGERGSPVLLHVFLLEKTYVTGETSSSDGIYTSSSRQTSSSRRSDGIDLVL